MRRIGVLMNTVNDDPGAPAEMAAFYRDLIRRGIFHAE
jgi:hypothetical protein